MRYHRGAGNPCGKDVADVKKFVPEEKMSKKARKQKAQEKREVWPMSPVTRRMESRKVYNRKRISRTRYEEGREIFFCLWACPGARGMAFSRSSV